MLYDSYPFVNDVRVGLEGSFDPFNLYSTACYIHMLYALYRCDYRILSICCRPYKYNSFIKWEEKKNNIPI